MEQHEQAWIGLIATIVVAALVIFAGFYAPCGCYAGTAVKDVPLRCIQTEGVPAR